MASGEDPRVTLARIHPEHCGTPNGYLQISRARTAVREQLLGEGRVAGEDDLPQYDDDCRDAWAKYTVHRRDQGGARGVKPGPPAKPEAEHGTVQRWRVHAKERRNLRRQGVPEEELPEIDDACRDAWRDYKLDLKKRKKGRKGRLIPTNSIRPRREVPERSWPECGTAAGLKRHRYERRQARAKGASDQELPPVCKKCQAEALRIRVLNKIKKARERKA